MIDAVMAYLTVGALVWLGMDGLGIIAESVAARSAHGKQVTRGGVALASVWMICVWPVFVFALMRGLWRR